MRNLTRIGALAIVLALVAASVAPVMASGEITVGRFIQQLARVKGLNASDPRVAADSLAGVGIYVPSYLKYGATLTEGDVAVIARAAGLNVKSGTPEAIFDTAMSDRFFRSFSSDLRSSAYSSPMIDDEDETDDEIDDEGKDGKGPSGKGDGKGKGKPGRTPTDPE